MRNQRRSLRRYRDALRRVPAPAQEPDFAEDVAGRLDDERHMRDVLGLLRLLKPVDRELIHLCVWTGLTYEEAAAVLGVPVGTIRSRLSRARARLRELALEREEER
jgi:RNA polymerase sigma-70 factor (ECF subfamily)